MPSTNVARNSHIDIRTNRARPYATLFSAAAVRKIVQLLAVMLSAAALAACAQSTVVTSKTELLPASRQAPEEVARMAPVAMGRRAAVTTKTHRPPATHKHIAATRLAFYGLASFYTEEGQTASGEKFDPHALTAAHRTLPFGTRLHVTNLNTGRSVTVRVNDRGPFVPGRIVDVSYAAAETLGMVGRGIAKVKLDVIQ